MIAAVAVRIPIVLDPLYVRFRMAEFPVLGSLAVSKQTDLYIAQFNKDVGQSGCEQAFGTFDYGNKPLHEVIQNPGSGLQTNSEFVLLLFSFPSALLLRSNCSSWQ